MESEEYCRGYNDCLREANPLVHLVIGIIAGFASAWFLIHHFHL